MCNSAANAYMATLQSNSIFSSCYLMKLYKSGGTTFFNSKQFIASDCRSSTCATMYHGFATLYSSMTTCTLLDSYSGKYFYVYQLGQFCTGATMSNAGSSTGTRSSTGSSSGSRSTPSKGSWTGSWTGSRNTPSSHSTSSSSGSNSTTIVIIVAVVVVLLVALIGFCCWRNKHRKAQEAAAAAAFHVSHSPRQPTCGYEAHTATASSQHTATDTGYRADTAPTPYQYQPEPTTYKYEPDPATYSTASKPAVHVYSDAPSAHVYDPEAAAKAMATRTAGSTGTSGTKTGASSSSVASDTGLDMCNLDMHRLATTDVALIKPLAQGAYGEVWLGQLEGGMVAVKKLLNHKRDKAELQKFIYEIALVAKIDCPYIVRFIGVTWTRPSDIMLVTEYMDGGDLRNLLQANLTSKSVSWPQKVRVALDIAEALVYLHSLEPKVIHRDLKSRNVLLNSKVEAKLTDFGVSRETDDATMTAGIGTYRWMAPEVLLDGHYTESADVFSFGVILAELSNEIVPYSDLRNAAGNTYTDTAIMAQVMNGKLRPSFAADCPAWFRDLGQQCLAQSGDDRPTAMQASFVIKTQLRDLA
ncbi:protein kinase [Achlya hypogyna]|uniref:Protein kinase n=1 Tax=Achlya hypogyna TaxID=1202772 RepID=A0A1V9Z3E0_ACHHY|nr:protein kinase [Achlya hypogyna]